MRHPTEPAAALRSLQQLEGRSPPTLGLKLAVEEGSSGWISEGHMVVAEPSDDVVRKAALARAARRDAQAQAEKARTEK
eukprot:SAG11_NODE_22048_length_413_cov_0.824841_1_plen_78_part_01